MICGLYLLGQSLKKHHLRENESNGLDDFKGALYVCPNYMNDDIHSDHGYLNTWDIYAGPL